MTRLHRTTAAPAALVLGAAWSLAACGDPTPEIVRVAEETADALETGQTSSLWGDDAGLSGALTNLAGLQRQVDVVEVGEPRRVADSDHRAADVVLRWAWDLDEDGTEDWSYTTRARVSEDRDANWRSAYDDSMVAPGLGDGAELQLARIPAPRGKILAADGQPIVIDRPVRRVGIDKTRLPGGITEEEVRAAASTVAQIAGLPDPAGYADRVLAAGPRAFVEAITVREEAHDLDLAALEGLPGAAALPGQLPLAPTSTWARPLLGRVGEATAEVVEGSGGAIHPGDQVGLSGIQKTYDNHLRGTPGLLVTSSRGTDSEPLFERPPVEGEDLILSLDNATQTAAEQAFERTTTPAGLVALRPSTGEIVAAASGPGSEGHNTAMLATLAPGSTFKMATALALLRAGVGPDDVVSCTPDATVSGYTIGNYPGYPVAYTGDITMTEAIAQSCNSALINARDQVTAGELAQAADALGIGQPLPVEWPAFTGSVPHEMADNELAVALIGQGDVLASPLAMATVAASVQAARTVAPVLVRGPESLADSYAESQRTTPAPLTADEAAILSSYMRAVVTEGTATLLADVPGEPVHAKTGSAEAGEGDSYRVDSWMIAFQGDLAVGVLVHGGGHGSGAAGTVVEEFLHALARGTA